MRETGRASHQKPFRPCFQKPKLLGGSGGPGTLRYTGTSTVPQSVAHDLPSCHLNIKKLLPRARQYSVKGSGRRRELKWGWSLAGAVVSSRCNDNHHLLLQRAHFPLSGWNAQGAKMMILLDGEQVQSALGVSGERLLAVDRQFSGRNLTLAWGTGPAKCSRPAFPPEGRSRIPERSSVVRTESVVACNSAFPPAFFLQPSLPEGA